jgi:choline monooxygenase
MQGAEWHFLAALERLAKHGDFMTTDVEGFPVLLRNHHGTFHAFLNVCAHRHSLLRREEFGNSSILKCQYHGWEYAMDGHPCRVPDAGGFRPLKKGAQRLRTFDIRITDDKIFVRIPITESSDTALSQRAP